MASTQDFRSLHYAERLYRLLLHCYPAEFRNEYSHEMLLTFRDCTRAALQEGTMGVARFWAYTLYDLAKTVCIEHVRAWLAFYEKVFLQEKEFMMTTTPYQLNVAVNTDIGRVRALNEDSVRSVVPEAPEMLTQKGALFVVSDGMGGHAAGEVASQITVQTVCDVYYQDEQEDIAAALRHAVEEASRAIYQQANEEGQGQKKGMGSTCIAAVVHGDTTYIANVGDSRAYLLRDEQFTQLSQDHSWVAEQIQEGKLTEEEARTHPQRNVITRALGTQPSVEVDVFTQAVQPGDILLLCTDGLTGMVTDDELRSIMKSANPEESVQQLIQQANANGGADNISAIVVHVA